MGYRITQNDKPWEFYVHIVDWDRRAGTLEGGADPRNPVGSAAVVGKQAQP